MIGSAKDTEISFSREVLLVRYVIDKDSQNDNVLHPCSTLLSEPGQFSPNNNDWSQDSYACMNRTEQTISSRHRLFHIKSRKASPTTYQI